MSEGPENHILSSIGPLLAAMLAFSASLAAPIHDPISHDEELFSDPLDFIQDSQATLPATPSSLLALTRLQ